MLGLLFESANYPSELREGLFQAQSATARKEVCAVILTGWTLCCLSAGAGCTSVFEFDMDALSVYNIY